MSTYYIVDDGTDSPWIYDLVEGDYDKYGLDIPDWLADDIKRASGRVSIRTRIYSIFTSLMKMILINIIYILSINSSMIINSLKGYTTVQT